MLYNDIVIDGMIKRAAYQAAQETVYMMKRAADMGSPDLTGPADVDNPVPLNDKGLEQLAVIRNLFNNIKPGVWSPELENSVRSQIAEGQQIEADRESGELILPPDDRGPAPKPDWLDPNDTPIQIDSSDASRADTESSLPRELNKMQEGINRQVLGEPEESAWSKILGHLSNNKYTYGGGVAGAGIGALLGDTPKSRLLYALLGGGGGAGLGALADRYL